MMTGAVRATNGSRPASYPGLARGGSALITGASSGIGEAFARTLAARGVSLLLTAVPSDHGRLESLAGELSRRHGTLCVAVPMDLSQAGGPAQLRAAADELGFEPDLIVNSAGVGAAGPFASANVEEQLRMIRVNVCALVDLTGLYLARLVERGDGAVINVASTAAFQPLPYFAVYAASKAFVLSFGEALWAEARRAGVSVVSVCTGPVDTPFHGDGTDRQPEGPVKRFLRSRYLSTERVVESALAAVERDRPAVVLRMPVVGLLAHPLALFRALVPVRRRLLLSERLNRWYFEER